MTVRCCSLAYLQSLPGRVSSLRPLVVLFHVTPQRGPTSTTDVTTQRPPHSLLARTGFRLRKQKDKAACECNGFTCAANLSETCTKICDDREQPPANYLTHVPHRNMARAGTHGDQNYCKECPLAALSPEETWASLHPSRARAVSVQAVWVSAEHSSKERSPKAVQSSQSGSSVMSARKSFAITSTIPRVRDLSAGMKSPRLHLSHGRPLHSFHQRSFGI